MGNAEERFNALEEQKRERLQAAAAARAQAIEINKQQQGMLQEVIAERRAEALAADAAEAVEQAETIVEAPATEASGGAS